MLKPLRKVSSSIAYIKRAFVNSPFNKFTPLNVNVSITKVQTLSESSSFSSTLTVSKNLTVT